MFPRHRLYNKLLRVGCVIVLICFACSYFGLLSHLFEESFEENFQYPYVGNVCELCYALRHNKKPDVEPINNHSFSYRHNNERKCKDEFGHSNLTPHLMIVVKSKIEHFDRRNAIRNSWGFERRFSDVLIRTIFSLGIDKKTHDDGRPSDLQKLVDLEAERYQDVIQVRIRVYLNDPMLNNFILSVQLHRRLLQQYSQDCQQLEMVQGELHSQQVLLVRR